MGIGVIHSGKQEKDKKIGTKKRKQIRKVNKKEKEAEQIISFKMGR